MEKPSRSRWNREWAYSLCGWWFLEEDVDGGTVVDRDDACLVLLHQIITANAEMCFGRRSWVIPSPSLLLALVNVVVEHHN